MNERRYLHEDLTSGKCFLIEYTGGSSPQLIERTITREQYTEARAVIRRQDLAAEERAELIESILDDLEALGLIRQTTKKAGA